MYNESIKKRWIEYKMKTTILPEGALERAFNAMEEYENRFKRDVYEFTMFDILEAYASMLFTSTDSLTVHNSYMRQYTDFCIANNMSKTNMNFYDVIWKDTIFGLVNDRVIERRVISYEKISNFVNKLPMYVDKFVLLALYEGVVGYDYGDLAYIKISDINCENQTISTKRGEVKVSKKLINYAIMAHSEKGYSGVSGTGTVQHPYVESEFILKKVGQVRNNDYEHNKRRVYQKMSKIFSYLEIDEWVRINSIVDSGKISWIKNNISSDDVNNLFFKNKMNIDKKNEFEYQFNSKATRHWYYKFEKYLR